MNKQVEFFSVGDELSEKQNHLWLIIDGAIKSYTVTQEGKTIILGFWSKQEVVGKSLSSINPYFLQCLSNVKAIAIPLSQKHLIPNFLLNRIEQIQQLSYIIREPQISNRLLLLLKWLAIKFGRKVSRGTRIDIKFTEQELADSLGTDKTVINRTLNQFQQEGLILLSKTQHIVVQD